MTADAHSVVAGNVLDRYMRDTGWRPVLPVPVEDIVERTYNLRILWEDIEEPPGMKILGALDAGRRTVLLNERHEHTVFARVGPREFTLAHELGHWIYDVTPQTSQVFCRGETGLERVAARRERAANQFAARLVLPDALLRAEAGPAELADLSAFAKRCGVSAQTMKIRLEEIGLYGE